MPTGHGQAVRAIKTTTVYDVPVPEKTVALRASDGSLPTISWTMTDPRGLPVDLTDSLVAGSVPVALRIREASAGGGGNSYSADATCVDPANGLLSAAVDVSVFGGPGVFVCEFGVLDAVGGRPFFVNTFYLVVEPSLFGADRVATGPLTVPEMRLHMRDSSPAENRLTDTLEFDDAEYAAAVVAAVDYWNDSPPPIDVWFTTQTFPYRYMWKEAAAAGLYRIAAAWYRKNHLAYQSGGLGVDDLDKAQDCEAVADKKWGDFKAWTTSVKAGLNMDACWGDVGSGYGRGYSQSGSGYGVVG